MKKGLIKSILVPSIPIFLANIFMYQLPEFYKLNLRGGSSCFCSKINFSDTAKRDPQRYYIFNVKITKTKTRRHYG